MPPQDAAGAHPRGIVELLDDAWRLYFADAPLLLALTLLWWLPAITCLVAMMADPAAPFWLVALAAALWILTGLSSGACQEAFHSWTENYDVQLGECLLAACKRGAFHLGSRALGLLAPAAALGFAFSPVLPGRARVFGALLFGAAAMFTAPFELTRQPSFAAGMKRFWHAVRFGFDCGGAHLGRALLLLSMRVVLVLFAVFNLHLMVRFALWAAEDLGGFDVAYTRVLFSLGNGAYALTLTLLAWALLIPLHEAAAYLFFVDIRARREGLDLWQRVETEFPLARPAKTAALVLAVCLGWLVSTPARAERPLDAVRAARQDVSAIRKEIAAVEPYPGGKRWLPRLKEIGKRLESSVPDQPEGFRWFPRAIEHFPDHSQAQAVELLEDIDARLALVEDSLADKRPGADGPPRDIIKRLVPPEKRAEAKVAPLPVEKDKEPERKDPVEHDEGGFGGGHRGPGMVVSTSGAAGVSYLLVGLGGAALLAGTFWLVYLYLNNRKPAAPRQKTASGQSPEQFLEEPDRQDPAQLWRQADDRAQAGDFLGAVRTLYLAVLALLHRGGFIMYQRTRTNGEYADQLRRRAALHRPFLGLTGLFEVKWYGERACASEDYRRCRQLAEEIRTGSVDSP